MLPLYHKLKSLVNSFFIFQFLAILTLALLNEKVKFWFRKTALPVVDYLGLNNLDFNHRNVSLRINKVAHSSTRNFNFYDLYLLQTTTKYSIISILLTMLLPDLYYLNDILVISITFQRYF
ncbi:hypothetical protein AHMF7605_23585 [Adhaeribacter arboris]|uniref:Uncharacterized protein n=1 Tax=Adhaeribacter arboris TaxID=2072846 RepID=A0A2T2YLA1_9BACT|nr:hypothetical protein AHMF7605_23585 [Adhaeribacter arboris]